MENKLSAVEWLETEGFKDIVNLKNTGFDYPISAIMERYANYKSREFQALILGFMHELDKIDCSAGGSIGIDGEFIKPYYMKYFNITLERYGQ
mgnify:CR=1 FL=1